MYAKRTRAMICHLFSVKPVSLPLLAGRFAYLYSRLAAKTSRAVQGQLRVIRPGDRRRPSLFAGLRTGRSLCDRPIYLGNLPRKRSRNDVYAAKERDKRLRASGR